MDRLLAFVAIALLSIVSGCNSRPATSEPSDAGIEHAPPEAQPVKHEGPPLTEFALTASDGEEFRSTELEGKVWVASFFFSRCASNCRALNMQVAELQREYGDRGLEIVSISCDPQYDTPEVLAQYAEAFNAKPDRWRFLTGEMQYVERVGHDMFELPIRKQWHEDHLVVIDGEGTRRGEFHVRQPEQFERLRKLLDELLGPPPDASPAGAADSADAEG
jgi:cytochrome oxidase Cu insertion factor (SCO1/SenC/PrrC family)